jgi:hypothetical protein
VSGGETLSVVSPSEFAILALYNIQPIGYAALPRGGKCALYVAADARPIIDKFIAARDRAVVALGRRD